MKTTRSSGVSAAIRTTILMAALTGLLVGLGYLLGGPGFALLALGLGALFNFAMYFFSAPMALKMSRAKAVTREQQPKLYEDVEDLSTRAGVLVPSIHIIDADQPNAFATGRSQKHAAVAFTSGLMENLTRDEVRGVIAHELAHIANRDILIQSVAATIGGAISWLGYAFMFGNDNSGVGLIGLLLGMILAPIAASVIQMAVSRQREYAADAEGAQICGNPESLASALLRLESVGRHTPMNVRDSAEAQYIIKPFTGRKKFANLFSTHPPTEERVRRLREMRPAM